MGGGGGEWGLRGGGEECGDGCVWGRWLGLRSRCGGKVGTYKYPVLIWPPNPPTLQYLYCCGAVGTAVLAHLWPFPSTFPACLQTIYFSLIHNTNGLEHAFLPFFRNKVALVNVTCNDCSCLVRFSFCQEGVM